MNHGYFVSLLWKGFRALTLTPKEWDCGLLCAFGNGRDGTHYPQVEWREKANPPLSRQSTFLPCCTCTVWSCTSAAWRGILGSVEEPAASQPFSQQPSGKLWCNPAWERLGRGGNGRGEEQGMCSQGGMQSRAAQSCASEQG